MSRTRSIFLLAVLVASSAGAQTVGYSPHVDADFPRQVYWGDTHLHTNLSLDANMLGNVGQTAADAYRFARGETVVATNGEPVKLRRPLDFLVVADHAEYLGVLDGLRREDETLLTNATARRWQAAFAKGDTTPFQEFAASLSEGKSRLVNPAFDRIGWDAQIAYAEAFNTPGVFTAFIGYEWTSMPGGNNLHRVVVFRDDAERARQTLPFSAFDSDAPEDLWAFLARYSEDTGGEALSIAHNPNLSGGRMFSMNDTDGQPLTREQAATRARYEPLVEVTQYKGDSEAHPYLSPEDEFSDYESWDRANISFAEVHRDEWFAGEYARSALRRGLQVAKRSGANPFRFGMIGSTDAHTGLAAADEDDWWGKFAANEPGPKRWNTTLTGTQLPVPVYQWQMAASGYAAVWARENTRASLFDAMKRRETYATTGPRMVVRFFGGRDFAAPDAHVPDLARLGYAKGVPMGAVLPADDAGRAPSFLVSALRDPDGANLDRVQIIKGWVDGSGESHEQVFDVAWAGDRKPNRKTGRLPAVGDTVDVASATYANTIGAPVLTAVWQDPGFDPAQHAFYYARVIEIPTPRWTLYDAVRYGIELPDEVPLTTQERAYTSPIWVEPQEGN